MSAAALTIEALAPLLPTKARLIGVDLGAKTMGLALSDVERRIATPLTTLKRVKFGRDADALAFARNADAYRNVLLVEQPNGNFADTIVRGYFYDAWAHAHLGALAHSSDERVAAIAAKARKEVTYHLRRSEDWLIRLGDGTELSHERVQRAVDELWRYTGELFLGDEIDAAMVEQGIGVDPAILRELWLERVSPALRTATLVQPSDGWMQRGGKQGRHSEALSYMLAEMQVLPRSYPGATW